MTFKELKPNYTIFVFDKADMSCEECKITSVSSPRFENKVGSMPTQVVDVSIEQKGKTMTYVFPDTLNKAYNGNMVFCIDKVDAIAEIKAMQRSSEQILSEVERHEQIVAKCHELLADLDTAEKERQANEKKFSTMQNEISELKDMFKSFMTEWKSN